MNRGTCLPLVPLLALLLASLAGAAGADSARPRRDQAKAYAGTAAPEQVQVQKRGGEAGREQDGRKQDWRPGGNPPDDPPPSRKLPDDGHQGGNTGGNGGHHGDGGGPKPPPDDHGGHGGGHGPGWYHGGIWGFPNLWPGPDYFPYYSGPGVFPRTWSRRDNDNSPWDDYDPSLPPGPHLLGRLLGAEIWAADGAFLGVIDPDPQNVDSICCPDGRYGSFQSPTSLVNPRCDYGAGRGPLSCWDPDTPTPPRLFWHGRFVGYLTTNRRLYPRTDPAWVLRLLQARPQEQ